MELKQLLADIHSCIEQKENAKITQRTMASRLGISYRTYLEYLRGTNAPLAMLAALRLLSQLSDQELIGAIDRWRRSEASVQDRHANAETVLEQLEHNDTQTEANIGADFATQWLDFLRDAQLIESHALDDIVMAGVYVVAVAQSCCALSGNCSLPSTFRQAEDEAGVMRQHLQELSRAFQRVVKSNKVQFDTKCWTRFCAHVESSDVSYSFSLPDLYLDLKARRSRAKPDAASGLAKVTGKELLYSTQFFTEPYMAAYLAAATLDAVALGQGSTTLPVIFDPAVGGSNMLIAAFQASVARQTRNGTPLKQAADAAWARISGYDIDPVMIAIARAALALCYLLTVRESPATQAILWDGKQDEPIGFLNAAVAKKLNESLPEGPRIILTNPPFLGRRLMDPALKLHLRNDFPEAHGDLSCAFTIACSRFLRNQDDVLGLVHQNTFWHLHSLDSARSAVLDRTPLFVSCNLGSGAFRHLTGEKASVSLSVFTSVKHTDHTAHRYNFCDASMTDKLKSLRALQDVPTMHAQPGISAVPDSFRLDPATGVVLPQVEVTPYEKWGIPMQGTSTGNSEEAIRFSWEIPHTNADWVSVSKGGGYSRWWGLNRYAVLWGEAGERLKRFPGHALRNVAHMDATELVFSDTGTKGLCVRVKPAKQVFVASGPGIRLQEGVTFAHLAYLNSRYASHVLKRINPKLTIAAGYIKKLPFHERLANHTENAKRAAACVDLKRAYLTRKLGNDECSVHAFFSEHIPSFPIYFEREIQRELSNEVERLDHEARIDRCVLQALGFSKAEGEAVRKKIGVSVFERELTHTLWDSEELDRRLSRQLTASAQFRGRMERRVELAPDGVLEAMAFEADCHPVALKELVIASIDRLPRTAALYLNDLLHKAVLHALGFVENRLWHEKSLTIKTICRRVRELVPDCDAMLQKFAGQGIDVDRWVREKLRPVHTEAFFNHPFLNVYDNEISLERDSKWK